MKLTGLKNIYIDIKNNNLTYGVFDFRTNGVDFNIFFDIGSIPFRLGLLPKGNNNQIWLNVLKGFEIDSNLSKNDYYKLIELLGLKTDKNNPFSPFKFFLQFNNAIPNNIKSLNHKEIARISRSVTSLEEEDKTVFYGLIEWDKGKTGNKRSKENLEKTRLLLPKTYEEIKDKNISVKYRAE